MRNIDEENEILGGTIYSVDVKSFQKHQLSLANADLLI